jgi:hypothetical protein
VMNPSVLATEKTGLRNRCSGMMGSAALDSHHTKAMVRSTPGMANANAVVVRRAALPACWTPTSNSDMPLTMRTDPATSTLERRGV